MSEVAAPTAPGVESKDRMKAWLKPPEDHALSPGPGMYPVHGLFPTSADTIRHDMIWYDKLAKALISTIFTAFNGAVQ